MNEGRIKMISNLLLLLTALVWGIAFVAQSVGTDYVGPWTFVCTRYILSTLVLIPVTCFFEKNSRNRGKASSAPDGPDPRGRNHKLYLAGGACCGFFLGMASLAQQAGIKYTTAGKAGFITALYVILVPLMGLLFGRKVGRRIFFCAILGLTGLYLISIKEGFRIGPGDALVILCAFLFSCQILCVDYFSERVDNAVRLANTQFFFTTLIAACGMFIFEHPDMTAIRAAGIPILYAGLMSGAVGYTLQIVAQKHTDPSVASLLMSMESVFSALAGWVILGQGLTAKELFGCVLLFTAVILSQIPAGEQKGSKENDGSLQRHQ